MMEVAAPMTTGYAPESFAYAAQPEMTYMTAPMVYTDAPVTTYYPMEQQMPTYVDEYGQPIVYVDEYGQPVDMGAEEVQYVDENGQPITFVDENGNPVDPGMLNYLEPEQPAVYNVSPDIFAKLAQGGALTEEEMAALTSMDLEKEVVVEEAEKPKKKKALKGSKKQSRSCC